MAKLATETDDNDDAIGDILKANDQCERIVNQYKSIFENDSSLLKIPDNDVNLVNLSSTGSYLLEDSHNPSNYNQNNSNQQSAYDPLRDLEDLFSKPTTIQSQEKNLINQLYEENSNNQKPFDLKVNNLSTVASTLIPPLVIHQNINQNIMQNKNFSETSRIFFIFFK